MFYFGMLILPVTCSLEEHMRERQELPQYYITGISETFSFR